MLLCDLRELRAKVSSLSVKVEKLGKLDSKLKSAFYACQTLDDVEHLVCLIFSIFLQRLHSVQHLHRSKTFFDVYHENYTFISGTWHLVKLPSKMHTN